jgi:RNA polymerase sigma-70 factor, ECF subfamily
VLAFFGQKVMTGTHRRFIPVRANGCPALGAYVLKDDGRLHAHSIQVLETRDGAIEHIYAFLDAALFAAFGLPEVLPDE